MKLLLKLSLIPLLLTSSIFGQVSPITDPIPVVTTQSAVAAPRSTSTSGSSSTCKPGTKLGLIELKAPTTNAKVFVDDIYVIKWKYGVLVQKIPKMMQVKLRQTNGAGIKEWKDPETIIMNVTLDGRTEIEWEVGITPTGEYELRLVPDGKDNADLEKPNCFQDGDPVPGQTGKFNIALVKSLFATPDKFPPASFNNSFKNNWSLLSLISMILIIIFVN